MKTLYLHIGWSKTGTSAVQFQLDQQRELLAKKGILYSKAMQMNDQAHHHFALAFNQIHSYNTKYNVSEALKTLDHEMLNHKCKSTIISSELATFYFNNSEFSQWAKQFEEIKVIATLRRQSEIMVSLFNQLVKDPHVGYKESIFHLVMRNIAKHNYFQHLEKWASAVGRDNIKIVLYDKHIVSNFLDLFGLSISTESSSMSVNSSLPNEALLLVQDKVRLSTDQRMYRERMNMAIEECEKYKAEGKVPERKLVTKAELSAIDDFFNASNQAICNTYGFKVPLFGKKEYVDIECY